MPVYDTYIELVPPLYKDMPAPFTMRYGFSKVAGVKGFQKTINQWIKALLTEEGSDLSDRDYGTGLAALIGSNVTSPQDVQSQLVLAVQKATSDVTTRQSRSTNLESVEMLAQATVTAITFDQPRSRVTARVLLENQAGQAMALLLPLPVTP